MVVGSASPGHVTGAPVPYETDPTTIHPLSNPQEQRLSHLKPFMGLLKNSPFIRYEA